MKVFVNSQTPNSKDMNKKLRIVSYKYISIIFMKQFKHTHTIFNTMINYPN